MCLFVRMKPSLVMKKPEPTPWMIAQDGGISGFSTAFREGIQGELLLKIPGFLGCTGEVYLRYGRPVIVGPRRDLHLSVDSAYEEKGTQINTLREITKCTSSRDDLNFDRLFSDELMFR